MQKLIFNKINSDITVFIAFKFFRKFVSSVGNLKVLNTLKNSFLDVLEAKTFFAKQGEQGPAVLISTSQIASRW